MTEDEELQRIRRKIMLELMQDEKANSEGGNVILDHSIAVSDATIMKILQKYPLVVIDCWAPWCGPCRTVAPVIEELARDYAGKIVFGKLNVEQNPRTSGRYGIMSIPTLLIFKKGKLVDSPVGALPRQMLEPRITKYLYKKNERIGI